MSDTRADFNSKTPAPAVTERGGTAHAAELVTATNLSGIPAELQALRQWVCWRIEERNNKPTKPPINPRTGAYASTTDPTTWGSFAEACEAVSRFHLSGIGFVFTEHDPYCGIDLDKVIDASGHIAAWAMSIVNALDSYTERSPSGRGLHVIVKATLPAAIKRGQLELYDRGRYFTMTGDVLSARHGVIADRQDAMMELYARYARDAAREVEAEQPAAGLSDDDILQRARRAQNATKFIKLWAGDYSDYPSQSEADCALCTLLAFWTRDAAQIDRLFRRSGLMREKWDQRHYGNGMTYGSATIERALRQCRESYGANGGSHVSEDVREDAPVLSPFIDEWPVLDEAAYLGLAGEIVKRIEARSEADPVALLVQILVTFGNVIGRTAHFIAEADRHYLNLYAVLVGESSKARKGSSFGQVLARYRELDEAWTRERIQSGLSSGEGLIYAVRDPQEKQEPIRAQGRPTGEYQTVLVDPGVTDKRLMVFESEFGGTIRVMGRDGSTLSTVIRQAWDTGDLRTLTKNSPIKATGAHVSIIAHITKDELLRLLDATDAANGFANRFLWVCARRSKAIADDEGLPPVQFDDLDRRLNRAVSFGRKAALMRRDEDAKRLWREVYPSLSEGKPGLLGAVISRAEAQVMRLACVYALLDLSYVVTPAHLLAALALWSYCEASARFIFGSRLGDPDADAIWTALRNQPGGLTRTEIRDLFGRHRKEFQIDRALAVLLRQGLAWCEPEKGGGRPTERWRAATKATKAT